MNASMIYIHISGRTETDSLEDAVNELGSEFEEEEIGL